MSTYRPDAEAFDDIEGRYAIVSTRWNAFIVDVLRDAALASLKEHGIASDDIDCFTVPGAFELPLLCKTLAAGGDYSAVIALGAVIRGGTPHFEYVSGECTRGIGQASLDTGVPIAFGVLTVDDEQQALDRAGGSEGNKGEEAALSAMEMVNVLRSL